MKTKTNWALSLAALLVISACSNSGSSPSSDAENTPADTNNGDNANPAVSDIFDNGVGGQVSIPRLASDPGVTKACRGPNFRVNARDDLYTNGDAMSYSTFPIVPFDSGDNGALVNQVLTLADGYIDFLYVPTGLCNYELYDEFNCDVSRNPEFIGLSAEVLAITPMISNVQLVGTALSFDTKLPNEEIYASYVYNDRNISSGKYTSRNDETATSLEMTVERLDDGTEKMNSIDSFGSTYSYIENPDCSGSVEMTSYGEGSSIETTLKASWTSPKTATATLSYEVCNIGAGTGCETGEY